jgi:hypothetical protein
MAKNKAKERAKELPDTTKAICFHLQKTLLTPVLTSSIVYYLRQLWTYNFYFHDLASGQANMYMWHEGEASCWLLPVTLCARITIICQAYVKHSATMLGDRTKISKF